MIDDSAFVQKGFSDKKSSADKLRDQLKSRYRQINGRNPTENELDDLVRQAGDVIDEMHPGHVPDSNDK